MTTPAPAFQFVFALYLRSWLSIALWHKADIPGCTVHVRYCPKADIAESIRYSTSLARENETGRRTVREQSAVGVRDAAVRCDNTTATGEDVAVGPERGGYGGGPGCRP